MRDWLTSAGAFVLIGAPLSGRIAFVGGRMPEWPIGTDCKSVGLTPFAGSNPVPTTTFFARGPRGSEPCAMSRRQSKPPLTPAQAQRWARLLSRRVSEIISRHPEAAPDNVRHTLILLEMPPLERLQRSLIRGRATTVLRK